jgi:tRNA modification GTPase
MILPALDDTIVALSTGWSPSPVGVLRLSGPRAVELVCTITSDTSAAPPMLVPGLREIMVRPAPDLELPATLLIFRAPRSYTGQDLVEVHTVGCLPLLRELAGRLMDHGARRALPGEFTARAFLNGRLDASQVDSVFALIHAADGTAARQAARLSRGVYGQRVRELSEHLADLLARVEAGIDFVEEEDVRFITADQLRTAVDQLLTELSDFDADARSRGRAIMPHVALAGLPNAGKSTLFNALVGYERAITSPVLGTTRDVLSAEVRLGGVPVVLQDCAGIGANADELDQAAHIAAEAAADQADLVLWVHDCTQPWSATEETACGRIPDARRVLVLSKLDEAGRGQPPAPIRAGRSSAVPFRAGLSSARPAEEAGGWEPTAPLSFADRVSVSAARGIGLDSLASAVARSLGRASIAGGHAADELREAFAALSRVRELIGNRTGDLAWAELVALELRASLERVRSAELGPLAEEVLGRIFSQFCVGK